MSVSCDIDVHRTVEGGLDGGSCRICACWVISNPTINTSHRFLNDMHVLTDMHVLRAVRRH
jgi:hypothetical protein